MARFEPVNNKLLVERLVPKNVSDGGILLPDSSQKASLLATVLSVPVNSPTKTPVDQCYSGPMVVGDIVLMGRYSGEDIEIDGKLLTLIDAADVKAILREN